MNTQSPLLVTGAAGFIGSRFVESCNARNQPLVSVDDSPCFRDRPQMGSLKFGTIIDRAQLFDWLEEKKPTLSGVVHMGACSYTNVTDPEIFRVWNVEYSQKLWDYCTRHSIPMTYASSAATYGAGEEGYSDKESLIPSLKPMNLYGQSKQTFDLWALEQEKKGKHPPAWSGFKFFNVYGYGENHKVGQWSVVLKSYQEILETGRSQLFKSHKEGIADGEQKRDFVWVGDVVKVLHYALEKPIGRGIFNLGTGKARTFLDLSRAVFRSLGQPEQIDFVPTPEVIRGAYQYFTQAEMGALRKEGYTEPFATLEEGVNHYVNRLEKERKGRL